MPEREIVIWNLMIAGYICCCGTCLFLGMYRMEGWLFDTIPNWNVISTRHHSLHRWSKHFHLCAADGQV